VILNLLMEVTLTPVFDALSASHPRFDETLAADYHA
jgi:hypothetical protein